MCVKLQFTESHMTLSPEHLLDSPVRETERGRSAKTWTRKCWPCRGWGGEEAGIRGALNLPDDWLDPSGEDRPLLTWAAPGGHLFYLSTLQGPPGDGAEAGPQAKLILWALRRRPLRWEPHPHLYL